MPSITFCPRCQLSIIPTADGLCPSCRQPAPPPVAEANPFAESPRERPAPLPPTIMVDPGNPLLWPGVGLFGLSVLSMAAAVYVIFYWYLGGLDDPEQPTDPREALVAIGLAGLMLVTNLVVVSGAIAMVRGQPRSLARAGAYAALVPLLGPCLGAGIPLGLWALSALRERD